MRKIVMTNVFIFVMAILLVGCKDSDVVSNTATDINEYLSEEEEMNMEEQNSEIIESNPNLPPIPEGAETVTERVWVDESNDLVLELLWENTDVMMDAKLYVPSHVYYYEPTKVEVGKITFEPGWASDGEYALEIYGKEYGELSFNVYDRAGESGVDENLEESDIENSTSGSDIVPIVIESPWYSPVNAEDERELWYDVVIPEENLGQDVYIVSWAIGLVTYEKMVLVNTTEGSEHYGEELEVSQIEGNLMESYWLVDGTDSKYRIEMISDVEDSMDVQIRIRTETQFIYGDYYDPETGDTVGHELYE